MAFTNDEKVRRLYRRVANEIEAALDSERKIVAALKAAEYLFYAMITLIAAMAVWYFISGEYLSPNRIIGQGINAQQPGWNTFSGTMLLLFLAIICYFTWKVGVPWREKILKQLEIELGEDKETLDEVFYGKGGRV